MSSVIETDGLGKTYGRLSRRPVEALKEVTFRLDQGKVMGLVGPNGAGKTTLLRVLATLLEPTAGTATVAGMDVRSESMGVREIIGYMPEEPGFYPSLPAIDLLRYWAGFYDHPSGTSGTLAEELLEKVGLKDERSKRLGKFSHGMRKRMSLAAALINDPEVLLLDEPASGLDPLGTVFLRRLIRELSDENKTILISSHVLPEVQEMCDTIGVLFRGEMIAFGESQSVLRDGEGKTWVEIECEGVKGEALEVLSSWPEVIQVEKRPMGIRVLTAGGRETRERLLRQLLSDGIRVFGLHTTEVTLEQALLRLLEGR